MILWAVCNGLKVGLRDDVGSWVWLVRYSGLVEGGC